MARRLKAPVGFNPTSGVGLPRRVEVRVNANVFEHRNDPRELSAVQPDFLKIAPGIRLGDEGKPVALHVIESRLPALMRFCLHVGPLCTGT